MLLKYFQDQKQMRYVIFSKKYKTQIGLKKMNQLTKKYKKNCKI